MRAVFMGTPELAVPSLIRLVTGGYDVVAVYTQPDRPAGRGRTPVVPPVKEAAERLGIPVLQPENLRSDDAIKQLAAYQPDFIVICAYGQILSQSVLDIPPYQSINIHFSLLPRYRGAAPVAAAILAGDEFTGVSLQLVRKKLDTGPLLMAGAMPVMPWDTTPSLTGKLSLVAPGLLLEALSGWLGGEREPQSQDESRATYFAQLRKEEGEIDLISRRWRYGAGCALSNPGRAVTPPGGVSSSRLPGPWLTRRKQRLPRARFYLCLPARKGLLSLPGWACWRYLECRWRVKGR